MNKNSFGIMLVFVTKTLWGTIALAECNNNSEIELPAEELVAVERIVDQYESFDNSNLRWPDETTIQSHSIPKTKIPDERLKGPNLWLSRIFRFKVYNPDSIILLQDMRHGDDWIIFRKTVNGDYFQVIDGRQITVVIRNRDSISLDKTAEGQVLKKLNRYMRMDALGHRCCRYIEWRTRIQSGWEGSVKDTSYFHSEKRLTFPKAHLWSNGRYIVLEIRKVDFPQLSKFGYWAEGTVGGTGYDYPEPVIRFSKSTSFSYKAEMVRLFPRVADSVSKWYKEREKGQPLPPSPLFMQQDTIKKKRD